MVVLKTEPTMPVGSLDELMAMAHAMEESARARYAELADRVRAAGHSELGGIFDRLARDEEAHVRGVEHWAQQKLGKLPKPADVRWIPPDTFDEEAAAELASSRLASPYRVLSMAVRNEERAFLLWTHIAAQAERADVREAAERMAHEELSHVALLRRARRQAYRSEGRDRTARTPRTVAERIVEASDEERHLAELLDGVAADAADPVRQEAVAMAAEARAASSALVASPGHGPASPDRGRDALATAESLVETYLDIADHSRDEAVVSSVQAMARQAIRRLGWLRTFEAERSATGA